MNCPQKPNNISSNINPMLCTVLVYFYKRFDQLKRGRFDKLKQERFDKRFIYSIFHMMVAFTLPVSKSRQLS